MNIRNLDLVTGLKFKKAKDNLKLYLASATYRSPIIADAMNRGKFYE